MRPVDQIRFSVRGRRGNCLRACIASLVEVDLDQVPAIKDMAQWYPPPTAWLDERGRELVNWRREVPPGFAIASGPSPRGCAGGHSVVVYRGELVHDPHPSRHGLAGVDFYRELSPEPAVDLLAARGLRDCIAQLLGTRIPAVSIDDLSPLKAILDRRGLEIINYGDQAPPGLSIAYRESDAAISINGTTSGFRFDGYLKLLPTNLETLIPGTRREHDKGYIIVNLPPGHPSRNRGGFNYLHRITMEIALGRLLESNEEVHHENEDKTDCYVPGPMAENRTPRFTLVGRDWRFPAPLGLSGPGGAEELSRPRSDELARSDAPKGSLDSSEHRHTIVPPRGAALSSTMERGLPLGLHRNTTIDFQTWSSTKRINIHVCTRSSSRVILWGGLPPHLQKRCRFKGGDLYVDAKKIPKGPDR